MFTNSNIYIRTVYYKVNRVLDAKLYINFLCLAHRQNFDAYFDFLSTVHTF